MLCSRIFRKVNFVESTNEALLKVSASFLL
jgi:hypothetical protein